MSVSLWRPVVRVCVPTRVGSYTFGYVPASSCTIWMSSVRQMQPTTATVAQHRTSPTLSTLKTSTPNTSATKTPPTVVIQTSATSPNATSSTTSKLDTIPPTLGSDTTSVAGNVIQSQESPATSASENVSIEGSTAEPRNRTQTTRALRWKPPAKITTDTYLQLSKFRLSIFVVLSQMAGFVLAPAALSLPVLLYTTVGSALCVASANMINQWIEAPYDAQMSRTRTRNLVVHTVTPDHVFRTGVLFGLTGFSTLLYFTNPVCATLGLANIILYTLVYTPLKRISITNTWAGAIVGAIPPLMGWSACTGGDLTGGALVLAAILYSWQFPHFNSLSWNLRMDYSKAGYRMMAVTDPKLNARVALRHALLMFPILLASVYTGLCTEWILLDGGALSAVFAFRAYQFWKLSNSTTARQLFFTSLVHLPLLLVLLILHKQQKPKTEDKYQNKEEKITPQNVDMNVSIQR